MIVYFHESFQSKDRILPVLGSYTFSHYRNTHIQNIHALNSDTDTLFSSILILNSQCVGVAIEGNDIWYMAHIIWALYITCDSISYSVIIFEIIIILFILSLLPNISYSVIKLPIIIIPDCTITDHTITDWSYYFLVLIPKVLLPILTITFCSYPELCYYR